MNACQILVELSRFYEFLVLVHMGCCLIGDEQGWSDYLGIGVHLFVYRVVSKVVPDFKTVMSRKLTLLCQNLFVN